MKFEDFLLIYYIVRKDGTQLQQMVRLS